MNKEIADCLNKCINESAEKPEMTFEHREYKAEIFKDKKGFYAIVYDEDGETVYDYTDERSRVYFQTLDGCKKAAKNLIDRDNRSLGEYELNEYGHTTRLFDYDDIDEEKYRKLLDDGEIFELEDILKK